MNRPGQVVLCGIVLVWSTLASLALAGLALAKSPADDGKMLRLASPAWPPYAGPDLPNQGSAVTVVRAAMRSVGWRFEVSFMPWVMAVRKAREDTDFDGYFPEYHSALAEQDFIFSDWIGSGPLGFAERQDAPIDWVVLDDLKKFQIGVVTGQITTFELDRKITQGELQVVTSPDDATNLRRLLRGSVNVAVIDFNVFNYLRMNEGTLRVATPRLRFNGHPLEFKDMFVALRNGPQGKRVAEALNEGLARIDVYRINQEYLAQFVPPAERPASKISAGKKSAAAD